MLPAESGDLSRALLEVVFQNATVALFIMDERQRCIFMNPAAEKLTGYTLAEVSGRPLHDAVHHTRPDGTPYPIEECPIDRALPENNQQQGEETFVHKNGRFYPVAFTASPIRDQARRIVGTVIEVRDISQEKEAVLALRESEQRFRQIANSMPQLAWMADASGWIRWYNERWYEYTGGGIDAMRGWGWQSVHHPEHVKRVVERFREHIESGTPWEDTFPLRGKDGRYRWFLSRAFPIRDEDGNVVNWFGTNTDINELAAARTALEEADRRKDEFIGMLSHELRNPLAPIRNSLYLLRRSDPQAASFGHALGVLERQTDHLARLVDDLLDVTRVTHGKIELQREPRDLVPTIQDAVHDHRSVFAARAVGLELRLPQHPVWADIDAARIAQVLGNLLSNALKFTHTGGSVRLELLRVGGEAHIRVADNGAGIEPTLLARLFKPFVQGESSLSRTQGGLGLGLALARGIVEMHGGSIRAESAGPGLGSMFTVRLPVAEAPSAVVEPQAAMRTRPVAKRVLIVDDNRDAADTLAELVRMLGHHATVAYDGAQALRHAVAERHDIVLCDIGLPDMSGYELVRRLRESCAGSPKLVAMSGYARPEDRARARDAGFHQHIAKPADLSLIEKLFA